MKIGFDLDKVFINYPPFVPANVIDWLYRNHNHHLSYRYPKHKVERLIRRISHHHLFRPLIKQNALFLHQLQQQKHHSIYLISSRYQFLEPLTMRLLQKYQLFHPFTAIYLNLQNEQPHLFKERILKKLKIDLFIDDDLDLLHYLSQQQVPTKLLWYNPKGKVCYHNGITEIHSMEEINKFVFGSK